MISKRRNFNNCLCLCVSVTKTRCFLIVIGWATAELVMTKLLPLWVGARGVEFDWKYMQMSFDANIALVIHLVFKQFVNIYYNIIL